MQVWDRFPGNRSRQGGPAQGGHDPRPGAPTRTPAHWRPLPRVAARPGRALQSFRWEGNQVEPILRELLDGLPERFNRGIELGPQFTE